MRWLCGLGASILPVVNALPEVSRIRSGLYPPYDGPPGLRSSSRPRSPSSSASPMLQPSDRVSLFFSIPFCRCERSAFADRGKQSIDHFQIYLENTRNYVQSKKMRKDSRGISRNFSRMIYDVFRSLIILIIKFLSKYYRSFIFFSLVLKSFVYTFFASRAFLCKNVYVYAISYLFNLFY